MSTQDYLTWLNTSGKQDTLENYLDWIVQEQNDNDISDVFMLASTGKLVIKKCSSVHAETVGKWIGDHAAKSPVIDFLNCGKPQYVDYIFDTMILRLFYVSIEKCSVVIGFMNTRSCYIGRFEPFTLDYVKKISEYPCPPLLEPLIILYFYKPIQYPVTPSNRAPQDLGKAKFFAVDTEDNGRNVIGNCIGADISFWIRTEIYRPKVIYLSCGMITTPFNEIDTRLFTESTSDWMIFLKKVFVGCNRIEVDSMDNPACPQELQQELAQIGGEHPTLTNMGREPELVLQLTFKGD